MFLRVGSSLGVSTPSVAPMAAQTPVDLAGPEDDTFMDAEEAGSPVKRARLLKLSKPNEQQAEDAALEAMMTRCCKMAMETTATQIDENFKNLKDTFKSELDNHKQEVSDILSQRIDPLEKRMSEFDAKFKDIEDQLKNTSSCPEPTRRHRT